MPLKIDQIELSNPVFVAPMSGVSDAPFRRAAFEFGAGLVVSEMVASEELVRARPDVVRRAAEAEGVEPFVIQLAGREAAWMAQGAKLAVAAGADVVDINMGCPSRQVTGALSGSALMRDPDHAIELVAATVDAVDRPVTLKMRLGWDADLMTGVEIAERAEAAGVKLITVHGRTRNQFYKGVANWRAISDIVNAVKVPVIANGDIVDLASARRALAESGADGVMIGRAAIGRAWLPGAIAEALAKDASVLSAPSRTAQVEAMIDQYQATIVQYGEPLGVRVARKHLAAFIDALPGLGAVAARRALRGEICQAIRSDDVVARLRRLATEDYEDDDGAWCAA